ncbi:hypothetical protein EDC96DRAFT_186707 [Choanephora cucurbitarum]|nr:hypothetical protein EDC96DRAFT_186707 [Choanephora cucurbitarum]
MDIPRDNVTEAEAKSKSFQLLSINTSASTDVATHIEEEEEDAVTPTLASVNALHDEATAATEPNALHEAPELDHLKMTDLGSKSTDLDSNYEQFIKQQEGGVDLESEIDTAYSSNELLDAYNNEQQPAHEYKPMIDSADKIHEDSHISESFHEHHNQQSVPHHRISAISEATTSSDQWFDPDDSWIEQQRKSALLAGFDARASQDISLNDQHRNSDLSSIVSDEYYYKRSSSTDHTGLDDDLDNDSYSHMDSEKLNSTQLKTEEATATQPFTHEDTYVQSSAYENISVQPTTYENINTKSDAYESIDAKSSAYENKKTQSITRVDTEAETPAHVHTDSQISTREVTDVQSSALKNIGTQPSLQECKDLHSTTQESASPKPPIKIFTSADVFDEDDYYSTQLHTEAASYSQKTTITGSIVSGSTQTPATEERVKSRVYSGSQEEEGEITVFMDPSDQQSVKSSPISSTDHNHLGVFHQPNVSTASLVSQRGQYLAVKQEDDSSPPAMIQVPSRTVPIIDHKAEQEYVPHDPNNPRVEDISHYMNTLPTLNKNNHEITGSSAFDTSASLNSNEESMTKRAISMSPSTRPVVLEDSRGIPNAHEMDFKPIPEERLSSSEESKVSFEVSQYGKMYIGVSGAHSVLLPLPKEITYVRCVISDGEFEYVSRYEILGPQILMDYECCVDVRPGTIITVSLLVRPDFHVKPKTGWGRLFTSIRKQKEHLSGYVHPEDGAIGQTRFAVDHMVSGCYKKTYEAYFDCFNSWYARTNRERARREQYGDDEDFLKIIGKMNIEMLYLPVSSPHVVCS